MPTKICQEGKTSIGISIVFSLYIFLSFFEVYIQPYIGSINRVYMLVLAAVLILYYRYNITFNVYSISIILWFAYKSLSVLWSGGINSSEVNAHMASQIAIVMMIIVLSGNVFDKSFLNWSVKSLLFFSFLYGVLSLFFSRAYRGVFTGRQVLTLFHMQNDPNNNAAFLIVAVSIALYSIVYEHRKMILNTVIILVNSYAILLTGSRSGFLSIVLVVGIIVLFVPFHKSITRQRGDNAILSVMIVFVLGLIVVYLSRDYLPSNIRDRLLAFDEYEEGSGRADKWDNAMKLFYESPIFGKGWGGYVLEGINMGGVHNTLITSLCDVGLFGTALFLIPIFAIIINAFRKKELMGLLILINGLIFSLTLDAINKRFLWNGIYISIMLLNHDNVSSDPICVWNRRTDDRKIEGPHRKYIR